MSWRFHGSSAVAALLPGVVYRSFSTSAVLRKRSGKPDNVLPYTQPYLPYETAPTKQELERERRRFAKQPGNTADTCKQTFDVKEVPENMFTYGKEGMTIPISIFKDQQDPVIAPEWTYPGIFENKVVMKLTETSELFEMDRTNTFKSPWQKMILEERVDDVIDGHRHRMMRFTQRDHHKYMNERKAVTTKATKGGTQAPGADAKATTKMAPTGPSK